MECHQKLLRKLFQTTQYSRSQKQLTRKWKSNQNKWILIAIINEIIKWMFLNASKKRKNYAYLTNSHSEGRAMFEGVGHEGFDALLVQNENPWHTS